MHSIEAADSALLVIDVQERLVKAMDSGVFAEVGENIERLVKGAKILNIPVFHTQQYTRGLGETIAGLSQLLDREPIEKLAFSCCGEEGFQGQLAGLGVKTLVVAGMETHVCVLQTVSDLLADGYRVHVPADAVISRTKANWRIGLDYMRQEGAKISGTETLLFQWMKKAGSPEFKQISALVK